MPKPAQTELVEGHRSLLIAALLSEFAVIDLEP